MYLSFREKEKMLGTNAMKRVAAGAHLPSPWLFEPTTAWTLLVQILDTRFYNRIDWDCSPRTVIQLSWWIHEGRLYVCGDVLWWVVSGYHQVYVWIIHRYHSLDTFCPADLIHLCRHSYIDQSVTAIAYDVVGSVTNQKRISRVVHKDWAQS